MCHHDNNSGASATNGGPSSGRVRENILLNRDEHLCLGKHLGLTKCEQHPLADSVGREKGIDLRMAIRQNSELSIWRGDDGLPGRGLTF